MIVQRELQVANIATNFLRLSIMALSLPGYRFDTALNKYFKLQPGELAIAPAATASKKRAKKIEAARLTKGKGRATVQDHQPTSLFRHRFEQRVSPFHSERNRQCVLFPRFVRFSTQELRMTGRLRGSIY